MAHDHFRRDRGPSRCERELQDRSATLACHGHRQRGVSRDLRGREYRPPPRGYVQELMEAVGHRGLRLDRQHPHERAHLQPHVAGAPCKVLGLLERVVTPLGVAGQEDRKPTETGCRAPRLRNKTRELGIPAAPAGANVACHAPRDRLQLSSRRRKSHRDAFCKACRPRERFVIAQSKERHEVEEDLPHALR